MSARRQAASAVVVPGIFQFGLDRQSVVFQRDQGNTALVLQTSLDPTGTSQAHFYSRQETRGGNCDWIRQK